MLQKLWNLVDVLFHVYASSGKNLDAIAWVIFKLGYCHIILGDTLMNFNNFSVCAMLIKFYGECPGMLRLLKNIVSVVWHLYLWIVNYAKISLPGLWILCRVFLWITLVPIFTVAS
jgi:hypothetical protein